MGWTFTHRSRGITTKEFFIKEFWPTQPERILAVSSTPTVTYMAVKYGENLEHVCAMVCLTKYTKEDYYNFGYKEMEESMGPCECDCPESILKLLTPIDSQYANSWRERCWQNVNSKKAIKVGNVVMFKEPVTFTDGAKLVAVEVISFKPARVKSISLYPRMYRLDKKRMAGNTDRVFENVAAFAAYQEQIIGA